MTNRPIATRNNLTLLFAVSLLNLLLLYLASHTPWWGMFVVAVLFSLSNNTQFSLLHESVHGLLAENQRINRLGGCVAALWFPTGWSIQRAFHLTHHRQNRSPAEQFDVLHPQDVLWLKYAQWYSIYSGIYWFVTVVGVVLYVLMPRFMRHGLTRLFGRQGGLQTGADSYIGILDSLPPMVARLEIVASLLWQVGLFMLLDLSLVGWLSCYVAFALMWSGLQYTDHAFSPLNTQQGAWNLHTPRWLRAVFLNYHLHLAHHQYPQVPWRDLPEYATTGPRFIEVWLACLQGPRRQDDFPVFRQYPLR